ncbi:MAG: ornithine cyclodeaminase family protein [Planctomycetia bacterium]
MPALFLREDEIERLLTMQMAIDAVERIFHDLADGAAENIPRRRARSESAMLHLMGAASRRPARLVSKQYSTQPRGASFLVHLWHGGTGELLAVMEGDRLGALRTGAASAVATRLLARPESNTVGLLGTGKQARTQLEGVCHVCNIVEAYVYSPNAERRETFARIMSAELGVQVVPVNKPELAVADKDVVVTATDSRQPVLLGDWLAEGVHINAVGSNFLNKSELDAECLRRCDVLVVDDREAARLEAGDLHAALQEGVLDWSDVVDLAAVLSGRLHGRQSATDVTLFKSVGLAIEDLAVAATIYDEALRAGVGERLPF